MIELTVKTLDSNNHIFQVEAETTVGQLKEKIRDALGFELDSQRLIFCGRVLLDEQRLDQAGINDGKCLHLVQRPPPRPRSPRQRDRDRMEGGHAGDHGGRRPNPLHNIRDLLNSPNDLRMEQQMASISPTAGRINFILGIITEIRGSLAILRTRSRELAAAGESGLSGTAFLEMGSSAAAAAVNTEERVEVEEENEQAQQSHSNRSRRERASRSMGPRFYANPRELGRMLEELDQLHNEFAPFRAQYASMLRSLTVPDYQEPVRQQLQDLVRLICDIMHSFAHCYHSISDITFNVGQRYPRLTSEMPAPMRHTIPVQAQINVVTATGPHSMPGDRRAAGTGNAGAAATGATATDNMDTGPTTTTTFGTGGTGRSASAAPDPDLQTTSETFNVRRTSSTDHTPIHTTTRTFSRPSTEGSMPSNFQVEIETRGHIAIPIDNNILAAVASNLRQAQAQHDRAIADAEAARVAAASYRAESDPIRASTSNRRRQNMPSTLIALDHLDPWGLIGRAASTAPDVRSAPPTPAVPSAPTAPSTPAASSAPFAPAAPSATSASAATSAPAVTSAPAATSAPAVTSAPSAPSLCPFIDPVRASVLRRMQQTNSQSENESVAPKAAQPSAPAAPAAQTTGSTFLCSAPINIGSRSAPVQGATSVANDSQMGASGATGGAATGASGATGSARPRTGAVPRTQQGHSHVHLAGLTRLLDQPADGSRPRILTDLDNMMRNLSGGVGMEVVMSMEEVPNFLSAAGLDVDLNNQGVYVTPLFAAHNVGGTPTADLLQNIVAIVRNRMMPQDPPQNQGQSQNRGQGQAQNQGQSQNRGSDQSNAERPNQWQAPWGGPRRRATDTEYPFAMACLVYDRYLNCDTVFSRQHLQERRGIYQQQAEEEQRVRDARPPAPAIDFIRERNPVFTEAHMSTMLRLLNEPITEQGQLNAFMITLARYLFLNPMNLNPSEPTPVPAEFARIRTQLRDYIQRTLEGSEAGRRIHSFEDFCERLIVQGASFLCDLPPIPAREAISTRDIDPTATLRAMMRSRLPSVIACIMSESGSDTFAARFYTVLFRFFADLCKLFMCFIEDGFDGLVLRFDEFVSNITENYGSATRNWLRLVAHENLIASRPHILANSTGFNAREFFRLVNGGSAPAFCCLYQAQRSNVNIVVRNRSVLPPYCRGHMQLLQPMQAPPLLPPPEDDEPSRGSTPTTMDSEDVQDENVDMEDEANTEACSEHGSQASGPDAGPLLHSEGASANGSPSHSRPEPQPEAEVMSAAESAVSEGSPRRLRRWGRQSPTDSQSLASDLTSESHPPGLIAINAPDADSLCDVEELDVDALVDDIDPYVCEYTEIRRPVVYWPLNIIEDDADDAFNENDDDDEVDIETIEEDFSLMAEDLQIRRRREKRERSIRRDVARRRLEGNIRHKKFITMHEAGNRLDLRTMHLSDWKTDYDNRLSMALDRVVEERKRLNETREVGCGTDEEHEEISDDEEEPPELEIILEEEEPPVLQIIFEEENNFNPEDPEIEDIRQDLDRINEQIQCLHPLMQLSLLESLVSQAEELMAEELELGLELIDELGDEVRDDEPAAEVMDDELADLLLDDELLEPEPADELLDPEPADELLDLEPADELRESDPADELLDLEPAEELRDVEPVVVRPIVILDELDLLFDRLVTLEAISFPRTNDAVRDVNDSVSDAESDNEYLSPIQSSASDDHPLAAQGAKDDWYSLAQYRYPNPALDNDGYFSPQLCMYHKRPGFLTPQPIRANDAAGPSAATTKSVSDLSEECCNDDFNRMVAHLRIRSQESSKTDQATPQAKDETQQATEIAENVAQTSNAETGRKDKPHTSDDNDLATQPPMEGMEDEALRSIMGSSWEPVLREDGAAQARGGGRPQPPFSDAYLSGMPARKRRCLRDSRPEATLDALMNDGLRGVSEGVPGGLRGDEVELTQLLRDSVRGLVAARARDQPEDYDPTRYPNTAAFLANADRTKTKEPEEKTPTPPKSDVPDAVE